MKNNRILVVDDSKSIHEDFRKVLSPNKDDDAAALQNLEEELFGAPESPEKMIAEVTYEVDSAFQGQEALELVRKAEQENRPYAMAFMDVRMPPGWDGVETIIRIWKEFPSIEMVLCTAYSDYTWEEMISKLGNTDRLLFVRKPFDAIAIQQMALTLVKKWNLGYQARNHVKQLELEVADRTTQLRSLLSEVEKKNHQLAAANKELQHVALHDPLTKLPNRNLFNDRLQQSIKFAQRENHSVAVFLMDVDKFKEINDTHGHLVGDRVLTIVGEKISEVLRKSDTVARLGGDEFALILPRIEEDDARNLAKKILQALEPPMKISETVFSVNVSMGIAMYPRHATEFEALLSFSDAAMYMAKQAGLGFKVFNTEEDAARIDQARLASNIESAISNNELTLFYQPIIDLEKECVHGLEALLRWQHPERGLIMPADFIEMVEHKGMIRTLTAWVFDTAIADCAAWQKKGVQLKVSVNLSPRNLVDPELPAVLGNSLNRWQVDGEWIRLEVTESIMISQPERAMENMEKLRKMGLHLAIDDFGTGYSSLSYLKKLPVKELKIDKSFVLDMDKDRDNEVIVKSTIELAHALGLKVVAEGVENGDVMRRLKDMGCDMVQGFYFCRPQSKEQIEEWLFESDWAKKVAT